MKTYFECYMFFCIMIRKLEDIGSLHAQLLKRFGLLYISTLGIINIRYFVTLSMGFHWDIRALPTPSYKVVFDYLKYWGGCGIIEAWEIGSHLLNFMGVPPQLCRLNGQLILAIFRNYVCVGTLPPNELDWWYLVLQHLRGWFSLAIWLQAIPKQRFLYVLLSWSNTNNRW